MTRSLATSTCDIEGHPIGYFRRGHGDPVLLVHGITTYSFIWKRIVSLLEPHHEVIGIDLLGCGASGKPIDASYSLKSHARRLKQFVDQLGIERFHYIGHDVGGGIGQIFAVNHTDRLIDLTLLNTVAYDFWPVQPIIAMRTPIIRQMAMATLDIGALRLLIRRGLHHKKRLTRELMADFWEPMSNRQGRKAFLHFAACLDNRDLLDIEDRLHRLNLPTLIIRGDADLYLSGAIAERLAANLSGSKLVRIPTGSHFIQVDEPERVVDEILQFYAGD